MPYTYTKQSFLKSIRDKYPVYNSWDDDSLYSALLRKYPVYKEQIEPESDVRKVPPAIGYTTESIQDLMRAKGVPENVVNPPKPKDEVTLKIENVKSGIDNLINPEELLSEAVQSSTSIGLPIQDRARVVRPVESQLYEYQPEMETFGAKTKYVLSRPLSAAIERREFGVTELVTGG